MLDFIFMFSSVMGFMIIGKLMLGVLLFLEVFAIGLVLSITSSLGGSAYIILLSLLVVSAIMGLVLMIICVSNFGEDSTFSFFN